MLWLINSNLDFFWKIDFCLREWSTGAFLQASFYEKNVIHTHKIYHVEVATWSEINLTVTTNIRKKTFHSSHVCNLLFQTSMLPSLFLLGIMLASSMRALPLFQVSSVKPRTVSKLSSTARLVRWIASWRKPQKLTFTSPYIRCSILLVCRCFPVPNTTICA